MFFMWICKKNVVEHMVMEDAQTCDHLAEVFSVPRVAPRARARVLERTLLLIWKVDGTF